jgi:Fic family protein
MKQETKNAVLDFIKQNPSLSSKEIYDGLQLSMGYATLKRALVSLTNDKLVTSIGNGRGTKYAIDPSYELLYPVNLDEYYKNEVDDRVIKANFNATLMPDLLAKVSLFTEEEQQQLADLQKQFEQNSTSLDEAAYKKEMERLAIDLSWKSSQIEGNTYSLLETERLLKDKQTAQGKTKDEAVMLLNHKEALDFIVEHKDYVTPLTIRVIEDIHSILIKELGVDRNIRKRRVGISGTNYKPLDNEFQITEALHAMCILINNKNNVFEKALLLLLLISYIQPFVDGNKRTARILSNAILMSKNYCPISFRTVDSVEYKKAMLLFYEQNNLSAFKTIFISQFEFAVKTYF